MRARRSGRPGSLVLIGHGGLCPTLGVKPDLATFGKIVGGGLPVGALAGRTDVMSSFDPATGPRVAWGGTFSANPLTMAAGLAALEAYDQAVIDELSSRGNELRHRLTQSGVKVNGRGSLLRIMEPVDVSDLWWALYRRGVLAGTNALMALSTAMSQRDVDFAAGAVLAAVHDVRARRPSR